MMKKSLLVIAFIASILLTTEARTPLPMALGVGYNHAFKTVSTDGRQNFKPTWAGGLGLSPR